MNISRFAVVILGLIIFLPSLAYSGSLDALAPPGSATSAMFTLEDIYKRLDTGTATAKRTGAFLEPSGGPGTATGHTVDEVMAKAPTKDAGGAVPSNVLAGKTFWGLTGSDWGTQTGSLATQTLGSSTTMVNAGFYNETTLTAVDADLATANIKSGVIIFGVSGDSNVVDTSSGDAVQADILSGKKAFVDGILVTGTVTAGSSFAGVDGTKVINIPNGLYSGGKQVTAVDSDLATGNIRSGITIFGIAGDDNVVDTSTGDATSAYILNGKIAWVDGSSVTGNIATRILSNSTTMVSSGWYPTANLAVVDTDLVTGNIKSGKIIFGVPGDSMVVDTSTGDATSSDILSGKIAWVDGSSVTGTLSTDPVCNGTLSGTRWCDNGNGTVMDMTTELVWLKIANWGDTLKFHEVDPLIANARDKATSLLSGSSGANLADGSTEGNWRLPTYNELLTFFGGIEQFSNSTPIVFSNIQADTDAYWSTTASDLVGSPNGAWWVTMDGSSGAASIQSAMFIWPVRGPL